MYQNDAPSEPIAIENNFTNRWLTHNNRLIDELSIDDLHYLEADLEFYEKVI